MVTTRIGSRVHTEAISRVKPTTASQVATNAPKANRRTKSEGPFGTTTAEQISGERAKGMMRKARGMREARGATDVAERRDAVTTNKHRDE